MPTVESVKAKLQGLIDKANENTEKEDTTLTDAVNSLVEKASSGGIGNFRDYSYFFYSGSRLELLENLNNVEIDACEYMFSNCVSLTSIPALDTSRSTKFAYMFNYCNALTSIPALDTSNGISFGCMFYHCSALTSVPALDTSKGTAFGSMFFSCSALTSVPALDTSNGIGFGGMFRYCSALKSVWGLDVNSAKVNEIIGTDPFANMFQGCTALEDLYLYNIRLAITIGSGTSYGHLLTVDSLVHIIKELCTVSQTTYLTMGSENIAKLTNLYCKVIDDTTEKIEMELCESTDDGAISIDEYAAAKGWAFK